MQTVTFANPFNVDDGLTSTSDAWNAAVLMKRINQRIKDHDMQVDVPPMQWCIGQYWDILDNFVTFQVTQ